MKSGLIVYAAIDQEKNQWFIDRALKALHNLVYVEESALFSYLNNHQVDYVIYRGRNYHILEELNKKGIKTYNNVLTNKTANDKYLTYFFFKENGLNCLKSFKDSSKLIYPYVMKSVSGHGGNEVFLINNEKEKESVLKKHPDLSFIYQEFLPNEGDARIYLVNKKVIAAVKRKSASDFRNNYSLGGNVSLLDINEETKEKAIKIAKLLDASFIGVDLLLTKDGYCFNEIEDPVGSRMLYQVSDIDIIGLFLDYLKDDQDADGLNNC